MLTVAQVDAEQLERHCSQNLEMSKGTLKPGELLGASTLIKRLWHETWLADDLGLKPWQIRRAMPMPNTRSIAAGKPFAQDRDARGNPADEPDANDLDGRENYFAILALDGDEMGKWISGSKSPSMRHALSPNAAAYFETHYPDFLDAPRAVTPSWHIQFSEALANFSLHAVQRVVEAFDGRLIYAGGDDVLAMLPAKDALACARALRAAFRGEPALNDLASGALTGSRERRHSDRTTQLFQIENPGYLKLHPDSGARGGDSAALLSDPVRFLALLPGPATDVSVGIAIAHFKAPLQDVVRAAQSAEKRAKRSPAEGGLGRGAIAVSLYKRSGETLEWGCRWESSLPDEEGHDSAAYRLLSLLLQELGTGGTLNARFPHKLEALLAPYLPSSPTISTINGFDHDFSSIIESELDHCLSRNEGGKLAQVQRALFTACWKELSATPELDFKTRLQRLINLLRTAAWMRDRSGLAPRADPPGQHQSAPLASA